jgi:hypothetical protein
MPLSVFALVCFSDKASCFCSGLASNLNPPSSVSHVAEITGTHHHVQPTFSKCLNCWQLTKIFGRETGGESTTKKKKIKIKNKKTPACEIPLGESNGCESNICRIYGPPALNLESRMIYLTWLGLLTPASWASSPHGNSGRVEGGERLLH